MERSYIAIDLKSFYASVECQERGLDPLTTNLVVADPSRTEKTICLAVSPSLKACGISGRARLFEVVTKVAQVNRQRLGAAAAKGLLQKGEDGEYHFSGSSDDAGKLAEDPALELSYIVAPPRMRLYEKYSTDIYAIYLQYVAPEDIHVYSIDEVFIDVTAYLDTYQTTPHEMALTMVRDVLHNTGITATAGIGTNMYLAKVAMDVVAKHMEADADGVRIAELTERSYRSLLWCHKPLTDFWRVGRGYAKKLAAMGIYTMGDIARASLSEAGENRLYQAFGINAELLIDHAWGWEPTTMDLIKSYRPQTNSISSGQVLSEPYSKEKGRLIVREMTELLVLDLVKKGLVTKQMVLTVGYDKDSLTLEKAGSSWKNSTYIVTATGQLYTGEVAMDPYGRPMPKMAHGTENLPEYTSSTRKIVDAVIRLYDRIVSENLTVRRAYVVAAGIILRSEIPSQEPQQLDLFTDYAAKEKEEKAAREADEKERRMQLAIVSLQERFGKNAVLKGMNLEEGATTIARNGQVGGHKA
ncbi:MAG: DNA methylase [Lachnospiraceae bacterium]|nr:DNA methylase [Lachnospiraceae bacterium]